MISLKNYSYNKEEKPDIQNESEAIHSSETPEIPEIFSLEESIGKEVSANDEVFYSPQIPEVYSVKESIKDEPLFNSDSFSDFISALRNFEYTDKKAEGEESKPDEIFGIFSTEEQAQFHLMEQEAIAEAHEIAIQNAEEIKKFESDLEKRIEDYFGRKVKVGFSSHLYLTSTMLFSFPTIGAIWDIGAKFDTVTIALYFKGEYFPRPLGSSSFNLISSEIASEFGLSFQVKIYELGRFSVNLGIESGWYQQWLMQYNDRVDNQYHLVNNGLMIRPSASLGWRLVGWWEAQLGLFYQTPLYPFYDGYQGWGVYLMIV